MLPAARCLNLSARFTLYPIMMLHNPLVVIEDSEMSIRICSRSSVRRARSFDFLSPITDERTFRWSP
jgi:hypothetical protein